MNLVTKAELFGHVPTVVLAVADVILPFVIGGIKTFRCRIYMVIALLAGSLYSIWQKPFFKKIYLLFSGKLPIFLQLIEK